MAAKLSPSKVAIPPRILARSKPAARPSNRSFLLQEAERGIPEPPEDCFDSSPAHPAQESLHLGGSNPSPSDGGTAMTVIAGLVSFPVRGH